MITGGMAASLAQDDIMVQPLRTSASRMPQLRSSFVEVTCLGMTVASLSLLCAKSVTMQRTSA